MFLFRSIPFCFILREPALLDGLTLTINTSYDVFPRKEVPFGDREHNPI